MKKAVFIVGAGASLDFGAPSTAGMDQVIIDFLKTDEFARSHELESLYGHIKDELQRYFGQHGTPNFEQIYHVAHELSGMKRPGDRHVLEYRPVLQPFLDVSNLIDFQKVRLLAKYIIKAIYTGTTQASQISDRRLEPLKYFFKKTKGNYICRIYTTNYDNFLDRSCKNFYNGFSEYASDGIRKFDINNFFSNKDRHSLFHLHGSIHFGYPHNINNEIGELFWFDNNISALKYSDFNGTDVSRMDGTQIVRTPIITGLDKLGRLQEKPLSFYHSQLPEDIMSADIIYVIGSGLSDLHINSWIKQARHKARPTPIVIVDYWHNGLQESIFQNGHNRKELTMGHEFKIFYSNEYITNKDYYNHTSHGWTVNTKYKSAIYDNGFKTFLEDPVNAKTAIDSITC